MNRRHKKQYFHNQKENLSLETEMKRGVPFSLGGFREYIYIDMCAETYKYMSH